MFLIVSMTRLRPSWITFQNVMEAIKEIKEIRRKKKLIRPLVNINAVILKESVSCLPEMIKWCLEIGVDYLSRGGLDAINFDENDWKCFREKLPEAMGIAKKAKFPVTLIGEVEEAYHVLKNYSGSLQNGVPKDSINMSHYACRAPWSTLFIEPDGTVIFAVTVFPMA